MRQKIAFKGRLLLRKILAGLSLGAVSLVFQACYGDPGIDYDDDWEPIKGTVTASDTKDPISAIRVDVKDTPEAAYAITGEIGEFEISVPKDSTYTVQFTDTRGQYRNEEVTWTSGGGRLDVELDLKN